MYITLSEAKHHLYVDHALDDPYIESCISAAEDALCGMLNRPLAEVAPDGELPPALKHALKILVGKFYANREGDHYTKAQEAAFTLANLFMYYRKES